MTILTSACALDTPVFFDYRIETNTQWDFCDFVLYCCQEGHLVPGDYLMVDNAAVHWAQDSSPILTQILAAFQITLVKLPTYSPELNPCELVFSKLKGQIRRHRSPGLSILEEVTLAMCSISHQDVNNFYTHCLYPDILLPECFNPVHN